MHIFIYFGLPEPSHPKDRVFSRPKPFQNSKLFESCGFKSTLPCFFQLQGDCTIQKLTANRKNDAYPSQTKAPQFMGPPLVQMTPRQSDEVVSLGKQV